MTRRQLSAASASTATSPGAPSSGAWSRRGLAWPPSPASRITSPEASGAEVAELTIFAWPGLVPDILKERSLAPFAKAHPKVNVKLDVSTNAVMYPKMLAAKANPAISGGMFNDIFVQRGIADGLWVKPNDAWMPNRKNVPGELMPPGGYGTIFQFTPFGIMYNPDKVEKPKSWADLWDPKYKGRVEMWDSYFDAYIAAA